jgi:hypothetical protein
VRSIQTWPTTMASIRLIVGENSGDVKQVYAVFCCFVLDIAGVRP